MKPFASVEGWKKQGVKYNLADSIYKTVRHHRNASGEKTSLLIV